MQSKATTVKQYLAELAPDRREAIEAIRATILKNLDPTFAETMQYGMIGYNVPHKVYPAGYHCDPSQPLPFASLASQKNHIGIYLSCVYMDEHDRERFVNEWTATGKRLDMGKSCVRVKKLEDVPLGVLGRAIKRTPAKKFIKQYEAQLSGTAAAVRSGNATAKKTAKNAPTKKRAAKKAVSKKSTKRPTT